MEVARAGTQGTHLGDPDHAEWQYMLGDILRVRFLRTKEPADIDEAIEAGRTAVRATPESDPLHVSRLTRVALALNERYASAGNPADADEALEARRAAVRAAPQGHPERADALLALGQDLLRRLEHDGGRGSTDEAVEVTRAAVRATSREHPDALFALALSLRTRFLHDGSLVDLDEAVEVARAAVAATPTDYQEYANHLSGLCACLGERYGRTGRLSDLDESVEIARAAVRATSAGHPDHVNCLHNLGRILIDRFDRTGELEDADEAVEMAQAATHAADHRHPDYAKYLNTLANCLMARFDRTREFLDLDQAVWLYRNLAQGTRRDDPMHAGYQSRLGVSLRELFEYNGEARHLDEAVAAGRVSVVAGRQDGLHRAAILSNFAASLRERYILEGEAADIDEAVEAGRESVRSTPEDHPVRAGLLSNLGLSLRLRFGHSADVADLDEAVESGRAAVRAVPENTPARSSYLSNLARTLEERFRETGQPADGAESLALSERVAEDETAPPWMRIVEARGAARKIAASDPARAAGLLYRAVLMLPEVVPPRMTRDDQQRALYHRAFGLADEAAALALADPSGTAQSRAARALRLIEAGRAVMMSQALGIRTDLSELHDRQPELARRLIAVRELLDRDPATPDSPLDAVQATRLGRDRQALATELGALLERIRACEGFADFGLPPTLDDLLADARHGPVVTFVVSRYRSDALLLTGGGITSCPLPELTWDALFDRTSNFMAALYSATAPDADRRAAQQTLRETLEWLWDAVAEPVLSALGEAVAPVEDGQPLPRVWWAPGGILGILPLHAAGYHTDPEQGPARRTVMDRVVSSYTPTIRALHHARRRRRRPSGHSPSLIVAMPTTPGHEPLRHVPEEIRRIRPLLHSPVELTEPTPPRDGTLLPPSADTPTAAAVLSRLPHCAIAHFACHGAPYTNPSQSRLLLHDHATTPLTVAALTRLDLKQAQLAYLAACTTASPISRNSFDEAIHLSSAFQLAGFPHVIGTLWSIDDRLAAEIAESFYTHLTTERTRSLDPDRAAIALHHTVRAIRDRYPATPYVWAAYLHTGA
ncbi:CHAT domain-containing protein [Streptomyces sp. NPDC048521]|uniref:CHAT domain-containing protein n=1 Tax=Streptomyces sp. NPDC048521 TaxID=3365566 RepID=UPI00372467C7